MKQLMCMYIILSLTFMGLLTSLPNTVNAEVIDKPPKQESTIQNDIVNAEQLDGFHQVRASGSDDVANKIVANIVGGAVVMIIFLYAISTDSGSNSN